MTVVFTRRALRDLDLIYEYVAADSLVYVQQQIERLISRASQIQVIPPVWPPRSRIQRT